MKPISQLHIQALLSGFALAAASFTPAHAQQAAQATAAELPAVVVEGASIAAKPAAVKPKAKPAPVEEESVPPPPVKKTASKPKAAKPVAAKKAAPPAAPTEAAEPFTVAAPADETAPASAKGETLTGTPVEKLGTSVSVVTGAELQARQIRTAADALRSMPGVSVSTQSGRQGLAVVHLRGSESNHTLVLIDGVEVNPVSDGFFDFSTMMVDDIAQIEVLRGPHSGLYSSGAIGGVINIVTKRGKGPLTVRAGAEYGSFDTRSGYVGVSGGTDRAHASLTLSGLDTAGFNISSTGSENDGGEFRTLSFTGGVMVFDNLKLDATLRRARRSGERDGTNNIVNDLFVASDDASTFASDIWLGKLEATLDTMNGDWVHKAYVSGVENENRDLDLGPYSPPGGLASRNISTVSQYGYRSTYRLAAPDMPVRHFITGLVEHRRESFEQPLLSASAYERDRDSIAAEVRGEYFDSVTLTGNVRRDFNDGFEDATTWRIAGSLQPQGSPFRLHSSVGEGIKYPSFAEQFGTFFGFVPNPNLVPETSLGWDVGLATTFAGGRAMLDVTYFHSTLQDEIDFNYFPPAAACGSVPFCYVPFNRTGESTRQGIEVEARAVLGGGLTAGLAYTYLRARDEAGDQEIRRAPHSGRADVSYTFLEGRANVNVAAIYNGRMDDLAFNAMTFSSQRVGLENYWLVNVAAAYQVAPGVELYGRVENLLDQHYQEVFGFETAGIAAYAGMRISFEEPATAHWAKYR